MSLTERPLLWGCFPGLDSEELYQGVFSGYGKLSVPSSTQDMRSSGLWYVTAEKREKITFTARLRTKINAILKNWVRYRCRAGVNTGDAKRTRRCRNPTPDVEGTGNWATKKDAQRCRCHKTRLYSEHLFADAARPSRKAGFGTGHLLRFKEEAGISLGQ